MNSGFVGLEVLNLISIAWDSDDLDNEDFYVRSLGRHPFKRLNCPEVGIVV